MDLPFLKPFWASDKILFSNKKDIILLYINLSESLAKTGIIDLAPLIRNLGTSGDLHASAVLRPGKRPSRTEREVGWPPELGWSFCRTEKSVTPTGIRKRDRQACSAVAITMYNKSRSKEIRLCHNDFGSMPITFNLLVAGGMPQTKGKNIERGLIYN